MANLFDNNDVSRIIKMQQPTTPASSIRSLFLKDAEQRGQQQVANMGTNVLLERAKQEMANIPVRGEMAASGLRLAAGMEDPRVAKLQEAERQAQQAASVKASSELARIQAALQNTTDPRVKRALASLAPSVAQGTLAGADLTTAIDKATSSYQIERMTEAEGTRYEGLVTSDERLLRLTTEPGIIAKVFGDDTSPAIAQAIVVDEIHRQRQLDPVAPMTNIIERTIDELQVKVNAGMDFDSPASRVSSTPPLETVSTEIPFVPAGQGMTGEEQRAYLEERKASTQQQVAEINRRVETQLDEEDRQGRRPRTARERANRAEELRYLMFKQQGMDLRPFGVSSAAGPL